MSDETDLERAADRLYAGPPADFTASRDALVKQARATGRRALATELASWRRPTVAAWLVNAMVRESPDEVRDVVALGAELRAATAAMSGAELRALSAQRHRLVQTLVARARALGRSAGTRVGEEALRGVEETLHAALADPEAADLVLGARLTQPLRHTGFALEGATAPRRPPTGSGPTARRGRDPGRPEPDRRAALEAELATEWATAREAADARDLAAQAATAAKRAADEARRDAQRMSAEVVRLREQLDQAERALADATARQRVTAQQAREAAETHRSAAAGAGAARRRVSAVQRRLDGARTRPRLRPTTG